MLLVNKWFKLCYNKHMIIVPHQNPNQSSFKISVWIGILTFFSRCFQEREKFLPPNFLYKLFGPDPTQLQLHLTLHFQQIFRYDVVIAIPEYLTPSDNTFGVIFYCIRISPLSHFIIFRIITPNSKQLIHCFNPNWNNRSNNIANLQPHYNHWSK